MCQARDWSMIEGGTELSCLNPEETQRYPSRTMERRKVVEKEKKEETVSEGDRGPTHRESLDIFFDLHILISTGGAG